MTYPLLFSLDQEEYYSLCIAFVFPLVKADFKEIPRQNEYPHFGNNLLLVFRLTHPHNFIY